MKYVYIDESGDIGRKSKFVVFAAIITDHNRKLEKAIKKVWRAKPQYHNKGRLHSVDVDDATRIRALSRIAELDIVIKTRTFKKRINTSEQLLQYYKELAIFITECNDEHIVIVERKDTTKKRQAIIKKLKLDDVFNDVIFAEPHDYKQLQAVDFVAWAYGRKLEQSDNSFSKIIEDVYE